MRRSCIAEDDTRALTPHLPGYVRARHLLRILDGVPYDLYRSMYNVIRDQRGSPQNQMDWTDPDTWIAERLTGEEQSLAQRIWTESRHELNPGYLRGTWYLTTKHDLLVQDSRVVLYMTERGRSFLKDEGGQVVAEIDRYEGVLTIRRRERSCASIY